MNVRNTINNLYPWFWFFFLPLMMCTIHSWHPFVLLFHQPSIKHLDYCISWGQYWEPLSSPLTPPKPHWDVCAATRRQNQTIINLLWPKSRAQKFVNLNNFAAAVLQHHINNIIIIYALRVTLEFKKKKSIFIDVVHCSQLCCVRFSFLSSLGTKLWTHYVCVSGYMETLSLQNVNSEISWHHCLWKGLIHSRSVYIFVTYSAAYWLTAAFTHSNPQKLELPGFYSIVTSELAILWCQEIIRSLRSNSRPREGWGK